MGRRATAYCLILPSFLLAAFIILWPLKEIANLALHDVNRFGLLRAFSGLANFRALFADPDARWCGRSAWWAARLSCPCRWP